MTPPTSLYLQPIAESIAARLDGIAAELKAYRWAPRDLDSLPAIVIEMPTVSRVDPDELDIVGLGASGWFIDYPVTFYVALAEAQYAQTEAVAYVDAAITVIDTDRSLGFAYVVDSSLVTSEPSVIDDRSRPLLAYECRLQVIAAVPDPDP